MVNTKDTPLANKVIEEASEVIHIVCKGIRFGWDNYHPRDLDQRINTDLLKMEMDHLNDAFRVLLEKLKKEKKKHGRLQQSI